MGPNFHETKMGHEFYYGTMRSIAKSLETIAGDIQRKESEKKKETERWFYIRVTGLQEGANCSSECICGFHTQTGAVSSMHEDIAEYISILLHEECNFEAFETALLNTPYDIEYGDYSAELYEDGKAIAIWRVERIPD